MSSDEGSKPVSRRQIARLIGSSELPMYVLDEQDVIVFANEAMRAVAGIPSEELIGIDCNFLRNNSTPQSRLEGGSNLETLKSQLQSTLAPPIDWDRTSLRIEPVSANSTRVLLPLDPSSNARSLTAMSTVLVVIIDQPTREILFQFTPNLSWDNPISREYVGKDCAPDSANLHENQREIWIASGNSLLAKKLRQQIAIARQITSSCAIVGPACEEREKLASTIVQQSSHSNGKAGELNAGLIRVDCDLMDAMLLDNVLEAIDDTSKALGKSPTILLASLDTISEELLLGLDRYLGMHPETRVIATVASENHSTQLADEVWSRLWMRISHFEIQLPELRERLEDLEAVLVAWFVEKSLAEANSLRDFSKGVRTHFSVSPQGKEALFAYPWPGSYSEFRESMQFAWKQSEGREIQFDNLPISIRTAPSHASRDSKLESLDLDKLLESVERQLIVEAISASHGNRSAAAKMLNISRARVIRRLQQWGLATESSNSSDDGDVPFFEEIQDD